MYNSVEVDMLLTEIKGVGKKKYSLLNKLGLYTVDDCIDFFPRRYIDRRMISSLSEIRVDENYTVRVKVIDKKVSGRYGKEVLKIVTTDGEYFLNIIFFNARYITSSIKIGEEYLFYGKVTYSRNEYFIYHPDFTLSENPSELFKAVQPIYRLTEGIYNKDMLKIMKQVLEISYIEENLPETVLNEYKLMPREQSIKNLHFPNDKSEYKKAKYRMIFEEFFFLQLGLLLLKTRVKAERTNIYTYNKEKKDLIDKKIESLPFTMTNAQKKVIGEVFSDMLSDTIMNRLIQGDVGSGKTLIAMLSCYMTALNKMQAALMVPTSILAEQHYDSFEEFFKDVDVSIALMTANTKNENLLENIKNGTIDIVIGTHAIIRDDVVFNNLGLVITDEQHRFGVNQRLSLINKGCHPDVLVMTATPIPRTLSMILYGDIDVSIIDELPKGRKAVKTKFVPSSKIEDMYAYIRAEVKKGRQVYIVYPLVEDSETLDLKSASKMYEELSKEEFSDFKTGLLHGKMKPAEKEAIMREFEKNNIHILFSTTVIEVGINVPNASIMIIEHSERFGLAQLHQLRGRVGRGKYQSYCFLTSENLSKIAVERIKVMTETNDGFIIADKDLEIRGPGDYFGLKQHGLPEFKLADVIKHKDILNKAQRCANDFFHSEEMKSFTSKIEEYVNNITL